MSRLSRSTTAAHARKTAGILLALIALSPSSASSQSQAAVTRIEPGCQRCDIMVEPMITLWDSAQAALASLNWIARASNGELFVTSVEIPTHISVFRANGQFRRMIGRPGRGPEEFRFVRHLIPQDSILHAVDLANMRVARINLGTMQQIDTRPLPLRPAFVTLVDSDTMLLNGILFTADQVGHPFHVVDNSGKVIRSFGYDGEPFRMDLPYPGRRPITMPSSRTFHAAYTTRYVIDEWNVDGTHLRQLVREVPWFRAHLNGPKFDQTSEPPPHIPAIHRDASGKLWVLITVADREWQDGIQTDSTASHGLRADEDRYFDTIIEVIDPVRGVILGSTRLDKYINIFAGDGVLAAGGTAPNGEPQVLLYRAIVRGN